MGRTFAAVGTVLIALVIAGCDTNDGRQLADPVFGLPATTVPESTIPVESPLPAPNSGITLTAPWQDGAPIPSRHTCDGDDLSPALAWADVPADATELAVTVTDLDASNFVHWAVTGIDPTTSGLFEGDVPETAVEWPNSFGNPGWGGPCPPDGESHLYQFTVHVLNQALPAADDETGADLLPSLNLLAVDQGSVSGSYARGG